MSKGSLSSSTNLFAHLQRWGRFCFYEGYHSSNVLGDFCKMVVRFCWGL
jgi:hypothetical protein